MSKKKYSRPTKPYDRIRIDEENELKERYGLKSKREIWKADTSISRIRNQAKKLITRSDEEKNDFIKRLQKKGYNVNSITDALALNKEELLKRRLQTIINTKKLSYTPKQARQLIVHKHVSIGEQTVNIPSYHVSLDEEPRVRLNISLKVKEPTKSKLEKIKEEVISEKEEVEDLEKLEEEIGEI